MLPLESTLPFLLATHATITAAGLNSCQCSPQVGPATWQVEPPFISLPAETKKHFVDALLPGGVAWEMPKQQLFPPRSAELTVESTYAGRRGRRPLSDPHTRPHSSGLHPELISLTAFYSSEVKMQFPSVSPFCSPLLPSASNGVCTSYFLTPVSPDLGSSQNQPLMPMAILRVVVPLVSREGKSLALNRFSNSGAISPS